MKYLTWLLLCGLVFAQNNARMLSGVNLQVGTSYTFTPTDATKIVRFTNGGAVAATLPSGATFGFQAGTEFDAQNAGAGTVTITCTGCVIYSSTSAGSASLQLASGSGVLLYSDGFNYTAFTGGGGGGGGANFASPPGLGTSVPNTVASTTETINGVPAGTSVPLTVAAPSGQTSDLADFKVNGVIQASISSNGTLTATVPLSALPNAPANSVCGNSSSSSADISCGTIMNIAGAATAGSVTTTATGAGGIAAKQGAVPSLLNLATSIVADGAPVSVSSPYYQWWPGANYTGFLFGTPSIAAGFTACTIVGGAVTSCPVPSPTGTYASTPACWFNTTGSVTVTPLCHFTMSSTHIATVQIDNGGSGVASAIPAATNEEALSNVCGTAANAGDLCYFNGTGWLVLSGNTSTTKFLQENASGVPSWNASSSTTSLSALTAAGGANTIANGNNPQVWNWAQTTGSQAAMTFGETTAASGSNDGVVAINTLIGSTATPLTISQSLNGALVVPAFVIQPTWNTSGAPDAFFMNVTNTASAAGANLMNLEVGGATKFGIGVGGLVSSNAGFQMTGAATAAQLCGGLCSTGTAGQAGGNLVQGSSNTSNSSAAKAGYMIVMGGMLTNATPNAAALEGVTQFGSGYLGATVAAIGDVVCMTTTAYTVTDCSHTGPQLNIIGIATSVATPIGVVTAGQAVVKLDNTATIGDMVCMGTTTDGSAHDSGGQGVCATSGAQIGVVIAVSGTIQMMTGSVTGNQVLSTSLPLVQLRLR